jgi:hypothetical protein
MKVFFLLTGRKQEDPHLPLLTGIHESTTFVGPSPRALLSRNNAGEGCRLSQTRVLPSSGGMSTSHASS